MAGLGVPGTMDEITPEWLTGALREGGVISHANVIGAKKETIGAGVGILGELARVTLSYDRSEAGAPRTLVAKIPTADPGGRAIANMLGYYEREVRFYREIAARCSLPSPKCYYTAMEPEQVRYVLLIEDLGGIRIGDQLAGCTLDEARMIVGNLASFHAQWWASPELDAFEWMPPANDPMLKLVQGAYLGALPPFMEKFGNRYTGEQKAIAEKLGPRMSAMQDAFASGPTTMLHADPRLDNMFFGSSDGRRPLTLIDWQILVKGRGPYDVGYFLSQSIDPAERRKHESALLHDYHDTLLVKGVSGYSWEQCWTDYRMSAMFCLAYPVISGGTIDLGNERGVALVGAMTDRAMAAIIDLAAADLLDQFEPA